MLLSAVSVLVVAQSSSEIPEGLMNNHVYGIFGALFIVLSNERDSLCIRMVALNAVTENLQMTGK